MLGTGNVINFVPAKSFLRKGRLNLPVISALNFHENALQHKIEDFGIIAAEVCMVMITDSKVKVIVECYSSQDRSHDKRARGDTGSNSQLSL